MGTQVEATFQEHHRKQKQLSETKVINIHELVKQQPTPSKQRIQKHKEAKPPKATTTTLESSSPENSNNKKQ